MRTTLPHSYPLKDEGTLADGARCDIFSRMMNDPNDPNDDVIPIERYMDTLPIFCPRRGASHHSIDCWQRKTMDEMERDLKMVGEE